MDQFSFDGLFFFAENEILGVPLWSGSHVYFAFFGDPDGEIFSASEKIDVWEVQLDLGVSLVNDDFSGFGFHGVVGLVDVQIGDFFGEVFEELRGLADGVDREDRVVAVSVDFAVFGEHERF